MGRQDITVRRPYTAIVVDGGFYRRRAQKLLGEKNPSERADELMKYCYRHLRNFNADLYRIFYYDCPPSDKHVYHPLTRETVHLKKSSQYLWMIQFLHELTSKRKVAVRRGEELQTQQGYLLRGSTVKKLCNGKMALDDLTERDFFLDITQKGVDMRIGVDIASLAEQGNVNQIIMISGDSDFVPAAKYARRQGIDFILDPMWSAITPNLNEHVDGIASAISRDTSDDHLHALNIGYEIMSD